MIKIIEDIRNSIKANCLRSALALTLTIPDICGKIKYPEKKVGQRYTLWFNEYVYPYYCSHEGHFVDDGTEFNGTVCYALRCAYLHSGNADVKEQGKEKVATTKFELCISSSEENGVYVDMHGKSTYSYKDHVELKIRLDVRKLCKVICDAADKFYSEKSEKEIFNDHSIRIIDIEQKASKIKKLKNPKNYQF